MIIERINELDERSELIPNLIKNKLIPEGFYNQKFVGKKSKLRLNFEFDHLGRGSDWHL